MKTRLCLLSTLLSTLLISLPLFAQPQEEDSAKEKQGAWLQEAAKAVITPNTDTRTQEQSTVGAANSRSKAQTRVQTRAQTRVQAVRVEESKPDFLEAATYDNDLAFSGTCEFSRASYTYSCN